MATNSDQRAGTLTYGLLSPSQEQLVGHRNSEFQIANGWNHAVNKTIVAQNLEFKWLIVQWTNGS